MPSSTIDPCAARQAHSVLDDIPGIGPARRRALMKHFQSLEAIRDADMDALQEVDSMNEAAARSVYQFFTGTGKNSRIPLDKKISGR